MNPVASVPTESSVRDPLARIKARNPEARPEVLLRDVDSAKIPRHVAIIMDGNGRWASSRGFPREFGHRAGAAAVRQAVTRAGELGIEIVTLYSFSMENWRRPAQEIEALMLLCRTYLEGEEAELVGKGIRFRVIGERTGLPEPVIEAIRRVEEATAANTRATLCLAINYGSRHEIASAARSLAMDAAAGRLDPTTICERDVEARLFTAGLPDPDLLIRTGGELRVSNFLLWQISYTEMHVTDTLWPDFAPADLDEAVREYARRTRRFGALSEPDHA